MRIYLIISKNGDSLPLAQRLEQEGHKVNFYINDRAKRRVGNGLLRKSEETGILVSKFGKVDLSVLQKLLKPEPDCIIMDMVSAGFGDVASSLGHKYPLVGGSKWGNKVELDRIYGSKVMKVSGINVPKTYAFKDYKKAISFVEENNKTYVYKPSGNQATTTTYVSEGPDDMIGMLEYYSDIKEEFELQERVNGIEVSTELWFNGKDVLNVNHTMEEKRLMEGNLGPQTGCMGSAVWLGTSKSKLFKEGVGKLVPALKKVDYRGPIDLNTIVTKDKLYGLEFTARFGYNALFVLLEMYKGRFSDLFYGVGVGIKIPMEFKSKWGIGIDLCVPPYPLDIDPELYKGILVQGINRHNLKHIWFYDIEKKNNRYMTSGNGGDICTVTARGDEVGNYHPLRDAKRRVMRTISNLVIPDMMYRRDIGDRVLEEHKQLSKWGWL